jgi:Raf kinase inhibitor-like YbhB/YbcL family protein
MGPKDRSPAIWILLMIAIPGFLLVSGCMTENPGSAGNATEQQVIVSSAAFIGGETIPARYGCSGDGVSPPISWTGIPAGTKSIAVLMEDLDLPGSPFTHWIIYNIPPGASGLSENISAVGVLPDGTEQGTNTFGRTGYSGPCPPVGTTHRYRFTVSALDLTLEIPGTANRSEFDAAIQGAVIANGTLLGVYGRE